MTKTLTPIMRLIELITLERKAILTIYFYASLSGVIYLSLPLGIQSIINLLFGGAISTSVIVLIFIVVAGVALNGWLQVRQMSINEKIQRRIFTRYSLEFAHKIPRLDLMAVGDSYLPELINRFFDITSLQKGLSKVLVDFPSASIQIVLGLILLSFYSPIFILFSIILISLISLTLGLTYKKGMSSSLEESNYKYEVAYWLEEVARTVKSIKFMGRINFPAKKADKLVSGYLDSRETHFRILQIQYWAFVVFKVLITAALLLVGCFLVIQQKINIGQFIATEIVIITLLNSVEKIIGSLDVVYDMLTSLEKLGKILDKSEETEGGLNLIQLDGKDGIGIKAENLGYRFDRVESNPLKNLNFEIKPGEKVCILGSEGSGKTSLLKLFTGAYSKYEGNLLFNSYPLANVNLQSLRNDTGVYFTSDDLFSGSLVENLTLGKDNISTQRILKTAEETGIISFIRSLKDGLDSPINSFGKNLSRSTVNRILITRAVLSDPKLLLLEDCWSDLPELEQEGLISYLTNPQHSFTLVCATNDSTFAAKCDQIILMQDGEITAQGTFVQVSDTPIYKTMLKQLSL